MSFMVIELDIDNISHNSLYLLLIAHLIKSYKQLNKNLKLAKKLTGNP